MPSRHTIEFFNQADYMTPVVRYVFLPGNSLTAADFAKIKVPEIKNFHVDYGQEPLD